MHYSDQPPPPNARNVQTPKIRTNVLESTLPFATQKAMELYPVTLYTAANCKSECDTVRDFLKRRGIPHSEKSIAKPEDEQNFKSTFKSTDVFLPSLTVGNRTQRGFEEGAWNGALDDAGYPRTAPAATAWKPAAPAKEAQ